MLFSRSKFFRKKKINRPEIVQITSNSIVLSSKICVPKETKMKLNQRQHISCDCKCKSNITTCNSKQKWNNKTCQCQFETTISVKKISVGILAHVSAR